MNKRILFASIFAMMVVGLLSLSGCSSTPRTPSVDVRNLPDAVPRVEPLSKTGNPEHYTQFGKRYWVLPSPYGFVEKGKASWYGKKFHGRRTSSGETYDMYAMSAAHKTLPIPTYAHVRNVDNGKTIVVRINDRGPFVEGRILDLSYAAATRLGVVGPGTANIELKVIDPRISPPTAAPPRSKVAVATVPVPVVQKTVALKPPMSKGVAPVAAIPAPEIKVVHMQIIPPAGSASKAVQPPKAMPIPTVKVAAAPVVKSEPKTFLQLGSFASKKNAETSRAKLLLLQPHEVEVKKVTDSLGTLYRVRVGPLDNKNQAHTLGLQLKSSGFDQYRVVN